MVPVGWRKALHFSGFFTRFTVHTTPFVPPACVAGIWKSHCDRRHHVDRLSGVNVVPKRSDPMSARPMGSASPELGSATGSGINFGCGLSWTRPCFLFKKRFSFLFFFFFFSFSCLNHGTSPTWLTPRFVLSLRLP